MPLFLSFKPAQMAKSQGTAAIFSAESGRRK